MLPGHDREEGLYLDTAFPEATLLFGVYEGDGKTRVYLG